MIIISEEVRDKIKRLDFYGMIQSGLFYIILGFYIIYLLLQFFTTGFRKIYIYHSFKTVLKDNVENKFKIKYHGKAWHIETDTDSNGHQTKHENTIFNKAIHFSFESGADFSVGNINSSDNNNSRYFDL
jgi:hypothetical protein